MTKKTDFPDNFNLSPGEISTSTKLALQLAELPEIDKRDPEQIRQRLAWYFDFCQKTDTRPLVTGICLVLNVPRVTLIRWESEDSERGRIIRKAKSTIRYLLESWSTSGKLSPPIAIFWAKNQLGMSDNVTITAQAAEPEVKAGLTPEEIARVIDEDIPTDEPEPLKIETVL